MGGNPVLEPVVHPAFVNTGLVDAMLHWGLARARQIAENQVEPVTLYSSTLAPPVFSERNLQASGFAPLPPNPASHNIYFSKPLQNALPNPELPPGVVSAPSQLAATWRNMVHCMALRWSARSTVLISW